MAMSKEEKQLREELMGELGSTTFDRSYLVEAGAGAGKTFTMVNRVVQHLLSGNCKPEQLVAITFTKKATEEMRGRLDEKLADLRAEEGQKGDGADKNRLNRLDRLIQTSGRMQISTIHSFCQTMLTTMPFASPLGFDPQVEEGEGPSCRAWFRDYLRANPESFARERFRLGVSKDELENFFYDHCGRRDSVMVCTPSGQKDKDGKTMEERCVEEAKALHNKLLELVKRYEKKTGARVLAHETAGLLLPDIRILLTTPPDRLPTGADGTDPVLRQVLAGKQMPLSWGGSELRNGIAKEIRKKEKELEKGTTKQDTQPSPAVLKDEWITLCRENPLAGVLLDLDDLWKKDAQALRSHIHILLHSWLVEDMTSLMEEYRNYKLSHRKAFSDDLLLLTRDMLRDNAEARTYFHDRYRSIYVDEFQDTDRVQTQILFYLTSTAETFDPDWRKCEPAPGSLFLVGDPKQAIYRFRGADINTYMAVRERFQELEQKGLGKLAPLGTSFRASQEICSYVNALFRNHLDGKDGQAAFAPMESANGAAAGSGVIRYQNTVSQPEDKGAKKRAKGEPEQDIAEKDARMLAGFIRTLVENRVERTIKNSTAAYSYSDFMILTLTTRNVNIYMSVLAEMGVPVNVSGRYTFRDFQPLARLQWYLKWLLEPSDGQTVVQLLQICCGVEPSVMGRFCRYVGVSYFSKTTWQKLPGLRAAFEAELAQAGTADRRRQAEELLTLCGSLEELKQLLDMSREAPALSVIQRILEGGAGLWANDTPMKRRRDCSFVLQYLAKLRAFREHSLPALVRYALSCLDDEVKQEIPMESQTDCVRVMNLHQAKGLEAPVVALAYSPKGFPPASFLVEETNGKDMLYATLQRRGRWGRFTMLAAPEQWEAESKPDAKSKSKSKSKLEEDARDKEDLRLLYVAATRAARLLLINTDGDFWRTLTEKGTCTAAELTRDDKWKDHADALKCLVPVKEKTEEDGQAAPQPAAVPAPTPIPAPVPAPASAAASVPTVSVSGMDCEEALAKEAAELSATTLFAITPSKLEHSTHSPTRKDRAEEPEDGTLTEKDTPPEDGEALDKTPPPKGKEWGTIVHSVLEQAVRHGDFTSAALARYALQAACDVLLGAPLTAREHSLLVGEEQPKDLITFVADKAAQAAAFLSDGQSDLRQLMEGGACYPELPFWLRVKQDPADSLYRHLTVHIPDGPTDRDMDVQGIIDLAICREDRWTVVDYKTDSVREGESWRVYADRLRSEYTAQIASYVKVLERMGWQVERAVLCSIPCGGKLIELNRDEAPAGDGSKAAGQAPED